MHAEALQIYPLHLLDYNSQWASLGVSYNILCAYKPQRAEFEEAIRSVVGTNNRPKSSLQLLLNLLPLAPRTKLIRVSSDKESSLSVVNNFTSSLLKPVNIRSDPKRR